MRSKNSLIFYARITTQQMVSLGGRRKGQDVAQHETHRRNSAFANYADHMKTNAFSTALVYRRNYLDGAIFM